MTASVLGGNPYNWSVDRDDEGHREYPVEWLVQTAGSGHGPTWALAATGLPLPGTSMAIGSTTDAWAFYQRKGSARLLRRESRRDIYLVTTVFSTRPIRRCQSTEVGNPTLEPARWSGGTAKYTVESDKDKDGNPLLNAAGERFTGPIVQDVKGHSTVRVQQNVTWLNLSVLADHIEAVNNASFWGRAARQVKCVDIDWVQEQYGNCLTFYKVTSDFEINPDTWDLSLLNEGDMVKIPGTTPAEFRRAKDDFEENVRVLLDADGNALAAGAAEIYLPFRVKKERNFSLVGWPATFGGA